MDKDKLTPQEIWNAYEQIHCKGVIVSKHFFVTSRFSSKTRALMMLLVRECYDQEKFSKNEVAEGKVLVRYGAFSHEFDGRFEIVDEIRIQYYHVVLKAKREFIISEYSKPAVMMSWPEAEENVYVSEFNFAL